jgi:hypothetical protein
MRTQKLRAKQHARNTQTTIKPSLLSLFVVKLTSQFGTCIIPAFNHKSV